MKEKFPPIYLLVHLAFVCSYICLWVIKMTKCFPTFHINFLHTLWALGKQTKKGLIGIIKQVLHENLNACLEHSLQSNEKKTVNGTKLIALKDGRSKDKREILNKSL